MTGVPGARFLENTRISVMTGQAPGPGAGFWAGFLGVPGAGFLGPRDGLDRVRSYGFEARNRTWTRYTNTTYFARIHCIQIQLASLVYIVYKYN